MKKRYIIITLCFVMMFSITCNAYNSSEFPSITTDYSSTEYLAYTHTLSTGTVDEYYLQVCSNERYAFYISDGTDGWDVGSLVLYAPTKLKIYSNKTRTEKGKEPTKSSTDYTSSSNRICAGNYIIEYHSMPIFNSLSSAKYYVETGVMTDYQEPSRTYNADELTLNSVDIQIFDSNSYDESYIEYYYKCDSSLIGSTIEFDYTYTYACSTVTNSYGYGEIGEEHLSYTIEDTQGTIRVYIKELQCIKDCLSGIWFNDEPISKRNVMGYGGNFYIDSLLYKVDTSKLDIVANITSGSVYGEQYVFAVDLKTGKANYYTNTPDEDGNYTYNDDYTETDGNYITIVDTDDWGNTTYNYYYYDYSDNSITEITEYPSGGEDGEDGEDGKDGSSSSTTVDGSTITNTNNNNPTFENNVNVNVSDDDVNIELDNIITDNVKEDDTKNFLALFLSMFFVLENNDFLRAWGAMFGWLPLEVQAMIFSAMAISACIGLYKLFKR